jgi:uncharacterized protein
MSKYLAIFLILGASWAQASSLCTESWYRSIDEKVATSDGQGHGPDVGSDEWKSVIEFKLGVRDKPDVPSRDSESWCQYIDQIVREGHTPSGSDKNSGTAALAQGPSYDCDKVKPSSIEAMICEDEELSALDRKLAAVYAAASKKAVSERTPQLTAEQRGWIKGRNECWKSDDKRGCVRDEYQRRIAELEARYRLVAGRGPVRFMCGDNPANEVVATFYPTDPPTLIAERGDSVSLMYKQPSDSGIKYQGRNESILLGKHKGKALITWGYGAPEMRCKKVP